jgi:hypothetical protein
MKIENIYPPLHTNNVLDTRLKEALHGSEVTEGALNKLNSQRDLFQTRMQQVIQERLVDRRIMEGYDMNGDPKNSAADPPGTVVDTYA